MISIDKSTKRPKRKPEMEESSHGKLLKAPMSSFPSLVTKINISARPCSPLKQSIAAMRLPGIDGRGKKSSKVCRYKIFPGNNCRVIMAAMKRRPWWHAILSADSDETMSGQQPSFVWEMYRNSLRYKDDAFRYTLLNHIQKNSCLVTKKGLYLSLKAHCAAQGIDLLSIVPMTFYLAPGASTKSMKDDDILLFDEYNAQLQATGCSPEDALWILKPASKTNRGFGIKVVKGLDAVMKAVHRVSSAQSVSSECHSDDEPEEPDKDKDNPLFKAARKIARQDGYIVQKYMEQPLLVSGRKFDIRCFVLVTVFERKDGGGKEVRAQFFSDAYVRTSCKKYTLDKLSDRATHLTNDAVQKHASNYGRFEQGNKLSLAEWQTLINSEYPHAPSDVVASNIFPEIKRMCKLSIAACEEQFKRTDIHKSFELFGYDFMVNSSFAPVLIEVNTNPCLEFVCPLLTDIISRVIEDSFKLAVDVAIPPPAARTKATDEAWELLRSESHSFVPLFP